MDPRRRSTWSRLRDSLSPRRILERAVLSARWGLERPVIFAVGLPHAGAALVTRYLLHRLELAHWSTAAAMHPEAPVVTTFLERRRRGRTAFEADPASFDSAAPRPDTARIWSRFFEARRITRFEDLGPERATTLRGLVAVTQRAFGGTPFLDDCPDHLLRIDALAKVFPESLFLVVRRRVQDVAIGMLRARLADAAPPDRVGIAERVASRVRSLERTLDADLEALPRQRVLAIDYEHFCQRPDASLGPLRRLLGAVAERSPAAGPFATVHQVPADPHERRLVALLAEGDPREVPSGQGRSEGL